MAPELGASVDEVRRHLEFMIKGCGPKTSEKLVSAGPCPLDHEQREPFCRLDWIGSRARVYLLGPQVDNFGADGVLQLLSRRDTEEVVAQLIPVVGKKKAADFKACWDENSTGGRMTALSFLRNEIGVSQGAPWHRMLWRIPSHVDRWLRLTCLVPSGGVAHDRPGRPCGVCC